MKKIYLFLVILAIFFSLTLFFFKLNSSPPCLNADEAAFSYNSYSILKTGKDEFGRFLPIRLISFGDYKLPLLTYLNIPFIFFFGLDPIKIKYINGLLLTFLIIVTYLLTKNLFLNENVAITAAFLIGLNWGIVSLARQLHEALLSVLLVNLIWLLFLKLIKNKGSNCFLFIYLFVFFISLFAYHTNRLFALFFIFISFIFFIKKNLSVKVFILSMFIFCLFLISDFIYKPQRVSNLFFVKNIGFSLKINELRNEGGLRIFYNKLTVGLKEFIFNYLNYFSPQFLVTEGDTNKRFGTVGLSPITVTEYCLFLFGLYYLFKNKERWRFLIISLLLISPIPAALSWAGNSLTRSFFILIPIIIISSYGWVNFLKNFKKVLLKRVFFLLVFFSYLYFSFYTWDFYLNHYPNRLEFKEVWQCGYQEITSYIKKNYQSFDKFFITKSSGPPYIFLLFFLKYPPKKFQPQAKLGTVDIYGFQQVEKFDKFYFNLNFKNEKKVTVIARPYEISEENTKKIKINNVDVFWIKEIR